MPRRLLCERMYSEISSSGLRIRVDCRNCVQLIRQVGCYTSCSSCSCRVSRILFARTQRPDINPVHKSCCAPSPQEKLCHPLESSHDVLHIVVSATDLGWPVRRRRVFTCGLSKASMAWLGPPQEQLLDHFKSFFAAQMEATADVFLFAEEADVATDISQLAKKRGFSLKKSADTMKIPLSQMYAPGQLLRYGEYEALRKSTQGEDLTWFADLEQNCGAGASTPGRILPSMLTHGTVHAWRASRKMTHRELYQAHGYFTKDSSSPIADVLGTLPHSRRQLLLGNGWHLPVMGSWLLYILAHCVRINRTMSLQPERGLLRGLSSQSVLSISMLSDSAVSGVSVSATAPSSTSSSSSAQDSQGSQDAQANRGRS